MDSKILEILAKYEMYATPALLAAMREVFVAGAASTDPSDSEEAALSKMDVQYLQREGIDPNKSFRMRNSVFTITGYSPSRWKFPISAQTQNGTRYKFTVEQVKRHQS